MGIAVVDVPAEEINTAVQTGATLTRSVTALRFSCNLTATPAPARTTTDAAARWVLMAAYGYYHMADGGGVYYYENFCGFFQCNNHIASADCLAKHWHSIDDDHGGRPFAAVSLVADVAVGAMPFAMAIAGDGNVPADYNVSTSVTYAAASPLAGLPVVGPARSTPVELRTLSPTTDMLGASLLARSYDLDMRVAKQQP